MKRLFLLSVFITSLFAGFHPLSLQNRSFPLAGEFKPCVFYPPNSAQSAFNWIFHTPNGSCYRLYGTTPSEDNVFGWKKVDISCDAPPKWLFYFMGDLDGDGDTRFDFLTVAANGGKKRVYRLLLVEPGSFFRYEDLGYFDYRIQPQKIKFLQNYIKYLGLKRNHSYKDLPKYLIFESAQEAASEGFDFPLDYSSYKLLLYKMVQPSGSYRIVLQDPVFLDKVIKIPVKIIKPPFGTADMAYYIAAFGVSKDTEKIVFDYGNSIDVVALHKITCEDEPAAPICGLKQIECITTPCEPIKRTYSNYCALKADSQAHFLHSGSCESPKEINASKIATSLFTFGVHLSRKLYDGENLFISPLSIAGVLDMLYFAARQESRMQIAKALTYPQNLAIGASYKALQERLHLRDATLAIANAAWVERRFHLYKSYRYLIEDLFDASIYSADFLHESEAIRQEINHWVEEKTHNKIENLLPRGSVQEDTRMVLVNALYFYGKWQKEFNATKTIKEPFYLSPSGDSIQVDMMNQQSDYNVSEMGSFRALELPYKNGELSMWLFLPRRAFDIAGLLDALSQTSLQQIVFAKRVMHDALFKMPKFKLTWGTKNIAPQLRSLGIEDIFDPSKANLSLLGEPLDQNANLFVSGIFQKTFIEVDEKGSEAAAATAATIVETSAVIPPVYTFYCDRPFVFMIVENRTLTPLFLGVLNRP